MKVKKKHMHEDWTTVYGDFKDGKIFYYLRLTPGFMELEKSGFPHGLAISGTSFDTREEAKEYSNVINKFFNQMVKDW